MTNDKLLISDILALPPAKEAEIAEFDVFDSYFANAEVKRSW